MSVGTAPPRVGVLGLGLIGGSLLQRLTRLVAAGGAPDTTAGAATGTEPAGRAGPAGGAPVQAATAAAGTEPAGRAGPAGGAPDTTAGAAAGTEPAGRAGPAGGAPDPTVGTPVAGAALGWDAAAATREAATAAGLTVAEDLADLLARCDVLVMAVPLPALPAVLDEIAWSTGDPYAGPVLTDVTSVKEVVLDLAAERGLPVVGGHPMAGSERSGFAAADAGLLEDARWVLCLEDDTDLADWLTVARLVTGLGARVVPTTAARHDPAVARISHLPHLLASALAQEATSGLERRLAAGSFRDGTRVAATREELTAAMCSGNADAVVAALDETMARLADARRLLTGGADLRPWFAAGRQAYDDAHRPVRLPLMTLRTGDRPDAQVREDLRAIGEQGSIIGVAADGTVSWGYR